MNPVKEAILEHMKNRGGEGTCPQWCIDDLALNPSEEFRDYVAQQSQSAVIRKEWAALNNNKKNRKKGEGTRQIELVLSGLPCPSSIAYRDEFIPGGWRTVLTQCGASVYQLLQAFHAHSDQKRAFDESHEEFKSLVDCAIERADGNLNVPLSTLTDDFFQEVG